MLLSSHDFPSRLFQNLLAIDHKIKVYCFIFHGIISCSTDFNIDEKVLSLLDKVENWILRWIELIWEGFLSLGWKTAHVPMYTIGILLKKNAINLNNSSFFSSLEYILRVIIDSFAKIYTAEVKKLILWVIWPHCSWLHKFSVQQLRLTDLPISLVIPKQIFTRQFNLNLCVLAKGQGNLFQKVSTSPCRENIQPFLRASPLPPEAYESCFPYSIIYSYFWYSTEDCCQWAKVSFS